MTPGPEAPPPASPPGWYQDASDPGLDRYWDGTQWVNDWRPSARTAPQQPPPARRPPRKHGADSRSGGRRATNRLPILCASARAAPRVASAADAKVSNASCPLCCGSSSEGPPMGIGGPSAFPPRRSVRAAVSTRLQHSIARLPHPHGLAQSRTEEQEDGEASSPRPTARHPSSPEGPTRSNGSALREGLGAHPDQPSRDGRLGRSAQVCSGERRHLRARQATWRRAPMGAKPGSRAMARGRSSV